MWLTLLCSAKRNKRHTEQKHFTVSTQTGDFLHFNIYFYILHLCFIQMSQSLKIEFCLNWAIILSPPTSNSLEWKDCKVDYRLWNNFKHCLTAIHIWLQMIIFGFFIFGSARLTQLMKCILINSDVTNSHQFLAVVVRFHGKIYCPIY